MSNSTSAALPRSLKRYRTKNLSKDPVVSFFIYNTTPMTQTLKSFNEYEESKSCSPLANAHSVGSSNPVLKQFLMVWDIFI
jgi:hypothetical protein